MKWNLKIRVSLLLLMPAASQTRAEIFEWAYVDPSDPSQGVYQSSVPCPGGGDVSAIPSSMFSGLDLTQAYLIGANLNSSCSLTLSGNGELILSGSNDYSGGTDVSGGTLVLANNAALADGSSLTVGADAISIFAGAVVRQAATSVPEPGALALLLAALWSVAIYTAFLFSQRPLKLCHLGPADENSPIAEFF